MTKKSKTVLEALKAENYMIERTLDRTLYEMREAIEEQEPSAKGELLELIKEVKTLFGRMNEKLVDIKAHPDKEHKFRWPVIVRIFAGEDFRVGAIKYHPCGNELQVKNDVTLRWVDYDETVLELLAGLGDRRIRFL